MYTPNSPLHFLSIDHSLSHFQSLHPINNMKPPRIDQTYCIPSRKAPQTPESNSKLNTKRYMCTHSIDRYTPLRYPSIHPSIPSIINHKNTRKKVLKYPEREIGGLDHKHGTTDKSDHNQVSRCTDEMCDCTRVKRVFCSSGYGGAVWKGTV